MPEPPLVPTPEPSAALAIRARWDGHLVSGITAVSPLVRSTAVILFREGGETAPTRKLPGRTEYDAITLERGLDANTSFEDWARELPASDPAGSSFRKEVTIELYHPISRIVFAWKIHRCWPSQYRVVFRPEANGSVSVMEQITLENEGWERDRDLPDPFPPVFRSGLDTSET